MAAGFSHFENFEGVAFRMKNLLYFLTPPAVSKSARPETGATPFTLLV
jgi:hypothetical protein